jgi:ribosomal protein S18 acetylase RimI-like enzyme
VPLKVDAFLSGILGKPAYHWSGGDFQPPTGPAFVDAKVAVDDIGNLLALQVAGFKVMDINVQLERPTDAIAQEHRGVRDARPADEAAVRQIASEAFVYDRFHRDPAIGHDAASRLKAQWTGNFFAGKRGDQMIVAEDAKGVCGFLQLLKPAGGDTVIDLIAVSDRARGQGMAQAMIALAATNAGAMKVGTQLANLPSLALYRKLGFAITSASHILHLHIGEHT